MGMKFASEFIGVLVVKSQLFKLVKGESWAVGQPPCNPKQDIPHKLVRSAAISCGYLIGYISCLRLSSQNLR
eukprot:515282-Pelagomonas_calceolata.AAC.1